MTKGDDFLVDVRDWIFEESGLGLDAKQIKTEVEDDHPVDPSITVYTGSTEAGIQTQDKHRPAIEYPRAQLIVRHRKITEALRVARILYDFMYEHEPPAPYETIWPTHLPIKLGPPDSNVRQAVGFAIRAQKNS